MSGICGIVRWDGGGVEAAWMRAMMDAAPYRGPDGRGEHLEKSVGLGYLSHQLTPESQGETQPVRHLPTGIVLSADLRLDNREELPAELRNPTPTDAELVLGAYLKWGEEFAGHLLGDFSLALWDPRSQTVRLARDPMGMRSLYYLSRPDMIVWATEVKQILAVPGVERKLNETAVATHLSGAHLPLGMSYYEGINQVEPGHSVTVTSGSVRTKRFWSLDPEIRVRYRKEGDYAERFREVFTGAVECRLRSVKPVGISLSGGMDSGSVASTVGWLYEQGQGRYKPDFQAYSWAFDELSQCDERAASRLVADRYGIRTTDIPADSAWPLKNYPAYGPDEDEPYIFYYSELMDDLLTSAKGAGVGLLMTGERGDATVGHWVYDYPGLLKALKWRALVGELSAHGGAMGQTTYAAARRLLVQPLVRRLRGTATPVARQYPAYLAARFRQSAELKAARDAAMPHSEIPDEARRRRYQLIFSAMSARSVELLERRQAMHGIDHADPWSDRRLAECVIAMPQYLVHRFGDFKRIARLGLAPMLTDHLRDNADSRAKANPTPLFDRGILERSRPAVEQLIKGSFAAKLGFADERVIWDDYQASLTGTPMNYDFWWFLTMEMWLRRHWAKTVV